MSRVTIEISSEEHQALKIMAAMNNLSMKDFILEKTIKDTKVPNKKTLQSFSDVKKGKNIKKFTDFNKFLKDLNS